MSSFEQLKQTFFDECGDLLQQIETGLTEIREGSSTDDTVNAVFRAVHSVKGGAGIFGFETLVNSRMCSRRCSTRSAVAAIAITSGQHRYAAGRRRCAGRSRQYVARRMKARRPTTAASAGPRSKSSCARMAAAKTADERAPTRGRFRRHRLHAGHGGLTTTRRIGDGPQDFAHQRSGPARTC